MQSIMQKCIDNKVLANERILKLGNAFLNAQQMSAQLAVYLILSLPLYHASRTFKFINTSAPQDRAFVLKPQHVLLNLEPESTDIMCKSIIDRYIERPHSLKNVCLAEFVSNYSWSSKKIIKCRKSKIIRFVHFNKYKDVENWAREQLLLYVPFDDAEICLKNNKETWKEAYDEKIEDINEKIDKFNYQISIIDKENNNEKWNNLEEIANKIQIDKDFNMWNDVEADIMEVYTSNESIDKYDLALDIHVKPRLGNTSCQSSDLHKFRNVDLMEKEQFFELLCLLNIEQRAIYDDIMYKKRIKTNDSIHLFLTGGANTGKTFTLQLIVQGLLRFYHSDLQSNPLKPKVLLMAFTCKTTFNIDVCTIHSTLHISINQSSSNIRKLSSEQLNKLTDDYE